MDRNLTSELQLAGGISIRLQALDQHLFNAGILEGLPTRERNARHLAAAVKRARGPQDAAVYVVPPDEVPIPYESDRPYPFGTPARFPEIACQARFDSISLTAQERRVADHSTLTILWWQEDWALPIDPKLVEHIEGIDWRSLAAYPER
jgi:hypothetical protein